LTYSIVTDTSANLPTAYTTAQGITVVPFSYFADGQEFTCTDTETFDGKAYYDAIRHGTAVTTSQVNPQRFTEYFEPILKSGSDILFISMSSGISGSYNSACIAAEQLKDQYPDRSLRLIDTLGASLGEGLWVGTALECREKGMSLDETADYISSRLQSMYQVFTVDDLMFLRRTGRLSNATAIVGTVLNIKPILKGNEKGQIVSFQKVRGRKKSIAALAEKYDAFVKDPESQVVGIAHADCPEDAELLASLLRKNHPPKDILIVTYEPVTGAHVGPATLALFFRGEEGVRAK